MGRIEVVENFSDPWWRINNLYSCVDIHGKKIPFIPNETQTELYKALWYFNIILKSRQHGITTFVCIMALDQCLFSNNLMAGICAHTRDDVEGIFSKKIKFPYDELPIGLKTARKANTDTAKKLSFSNGSSVEVATSLRSGTYQFALVSEFGRICAKYPEKAREIVTGTFETVHPGSMMFVESTAEGREGYFYRYVTEARKRAQLGRKPNKLQFKLHFYPWWADKRNVLYDHHRVNPDYIKYFETLEEEHGIFLSVEQQHWYATKAETLDDDMKREHPSTIDEAFEAAISGAYLSKQMAYLRKTGKITNVPYDPALAVNTGWDFGIGDTMCIWLHQRGGLQDRLIGYLHGSDEDVLYYWGELQKKNYLWGCHYLPHDAGTRRIGTAKNAHEKPKTLETIMADAGMQNIRIVPRVENKWTAIQEVKLALPMYYIDEHECSEGIKGLDAFRREWDDKTGDWKQRPHHDWAMHHYDALETLIRGIAHHGLLIDIMPRWTPTREVPAQRC
jgi:hypothetical protein